MSTDTSIRSVLGRAAREPLVRFTLIGASFFLVDRAFGDAQEGAASSADPHVVVISDGFVESLRMRQRERTGAALDENATEGLVAAFLREEALVREARAAGLDAGDAIVRRRLAQKMEFLVAAQVEVPEPTDEELRAWLADHPAIAARTEAIRFEHVFFSTERRGRDARAEAEAALTTLGAGAPAEGMGDPFVRGGSFGPLDAARIDAAFGEGFAAQLGGAPTGAWAGPFESAFGLHVVRVTAREPAREAPLAEVRARIVPRVVEERRQALAEREIARIVAGYRVVRREAATE